MIADEMQRTRDKGRSTKDEKVKEKGGAIGAAIKERLRERSLRRRENGRGGHGAQGQERGGRFVS